MTSPPTPASINFALLIKRIMNPDGTQTTSLRSENQGIPDAEIILMVEKWVEETKKRVQAALVGEIAFMDKGKKNT